MKPNVVVVFGGESVEHDISIITGVQTINAINKQKYNVIPLYIDKVGRWLTSSDFFSVDNFTSEKTIKKAINALISKAIHNALYLRNSFIGSFILF